MTAATTAFRQSRVPIYFFNPSPFNLLGAEEWVGNLAFVNAADSFDGRHPNVFVAGHHRPPGLDIPATNNALLGDPTTADFIRARGGCGQALFLMFDQEAARRCS